MPPRMLAATDGVLAVGTISCMDVPVIIQWWNQDPGDDSAQWDQVTDAAITVRTRRLAVMGPTDYPPRARKLPIKPDTYRVRIYYGGLGTLAANGLDGEDYYRVALWSGEWCPVTVLKQYPWRQGC